MEKLNITMEWDELINKANKTHNSIFTIKDSGDIIVFSILHKKHFLFLPNEATKSDFIRKVNKI